MSNVEAAPPTRRDTKEDTEITIESDRVESKKHRRKKKKKTVSAKDLDLHESTEEYSGMPQAWVDCKVVMGSWLLVTFLITGLSIVTIPFGCLLAFFACFSYFSKRSTKEEFGGQYLARSIYFTAYVAWIYDMLVFAITLLFWMVLVYGVCEDYDHNVCKFRVAVGYFVAAQMCMVFLHATLSFTAFLKMRDCCKDIIIDEKEARERFVDMEKQIYEEFKEKRKSELSAKKKKKKTTHSHKESS